MYRFFHTNSRYPTIAYTIKGLNLCSISINLLLAAASTYIYLKPGSVPESTAPPPNPVMFLFIVAATYSFSGRKTDEFADQIGDKVIAAYDTVVAIGHYAGVVRGY